LLDGGDVEFEDLDLGDGVGRRGKASTIRRGGGSGLTTSGNFQVARFQGNFEELGEDEDASLAIEASKEAHAKEIKATVLARRLGESVTTQITSAISSKVPITPKVQKVIDQVADEVSRSCANVLSSSSKQTKKSQHGSKMVIKAEDSGAPAR